MSLGLDKYNSCFITYKITPGFHTFKDLSEALFKILQLDYPGPSTVIVIEFGDITMKTKLVVKSGSIGIRFDEKSFLSIILGFTPGWDYKQYNEYISQKNLNLSNTNKIHLQADVIIGSVMNGLRQPILHSFVWDKPSGFKVFCQAETIQYKKNKSVLNAITFYLDDDKNKKIFMEKHWFLL